MSCAYKWIHFSVIIETFPLVSLTINNKGSDTNFKAITVWASPCSYVHNRKLSVDLHTSITDHSQDGFIVVINCASHLCNPGSTLAWRSFVGWVSVDLNLTLRVFLRVLPFSSLIKIDSRSITSGQIPSYRDNLWYLSLPLHWMNKVGVIIAETWPQLFRGWITSSPIFQPGFQRYCTHRHSSCFN